MRRPVRLLTKVAFVLALAGIILVLVGQVRRISDQTTCRNNLRQLGLGLQLYHSTNAKFPAATVRNPVLAPDRRLSWLFEIDPFVIARMDPTWTQHEHEAWDSDGNLRLQRGRIPWYECPRRTEKSRPDGLGFTSYVGATGVGVDAAVLPKNDRQTGVFGYERQISMHEITDGASGTVIVIETDWDTGPWVAGGPPTVRGLDLDTPPYVGRDRPFGGLHRGGVMTVMADGSVHLVRKSVSPDVLEALFTIAGGDVHDSPWDD